MLSSSVKVCVIGAGPNGLIAARHLSAVSHTEITVFDAGNDIGGLWNYDERNDSEPRFYDEAKKDAYYQFHNYFHGTVYQGLTTDVPYFFMGYKDLSHADVIRDTPLFVDMSQHKEYLDAYASKFDLKKYVTLNTLVVSVRLFENLSTEEQAQAPEKRKFVVKTVNARADNLSTDIKTHSFDYVLICTGHLSKPNMPEIAGIEKFKGKVIPAKNFRRPESEFFSQKRVLLVGSSDSAMDILVQLTTTPLSESELVKKLVLVGRKVGPFVTAEDFKEQRESGILSVHVGEIAEITGAETVKLTDGSEHEVDTIVLATGYQFNFPFLDLEKDKLIDFDPTKYRGKFFGPVYKKFIAAREPHLFFMGALDVTPLIYSCYEYHAIILRYILEGKITLPSTEEMIGSFDNEVKTMQEKGQVLTNFFNPTRFSDDFVYWNDLRRMIKEVRPSDDIKAEAYIQPLFAAFKKLMEFTEKGDILAGETHNYYNEFPKELRDTSEFI